MTIMMHFVGLQLQTLEDLRRIFHNSWKKYDVDKGYNRNVVRIPFRFDKKECVTILRVLDKAIEERRRFKMAFEEWMRWGQSLTDYVSNTSSDVRLLWRLITDIPQLENRRGRPQQQWKPRNNKQKSKNRYLPILSSKLER
jgi:hypothetical protein